MGNARWPDQIRNQCEICTQLQDDYDDPARQTYIIFIFIFLCRIILYFRNNRRRINNETTRCDKRRDG